MIYEITNTDVVAPLFGNWQESLIWSCLQGVMGKIYRQRGLAYVCAAKLILECLERDLYPSWDAKTKISVALAEKLGYHYSHTYTSIEVRGY